MTHFVVGLDLSLTATGVADSTGTRTIKAGDLRGCERLFWISADIFGDGTVQAADLVVIEGPAYSRALGAGHHEAAGLWWRVVCRLAAHDVPYAVVSPSSLKRYATGKGNATKPDMRVELLKRAGLDLRDDNQVDAHFLRSMGMRHLGHPIEQLPALHLAAMEKVQWPTTP
ncbi:hypothetical protein ACIBHY_16995 [Nonomuraea sp. NPDC050547]|uniref:hypothetical protein n=1 Tax=Nonomuraea sp. NPDC050547 TaxID=3364368 RepID=UPI0037BD5301